MNKKEIHQLLEEKYHQYAQPQYFTDDPVSVLNYFKKKQDMEIAGFLAALLAWGKREKILEAAMKLLYLMNYEPHHFILHHTPSDRKRFASFVYRTFNGNDIMDILNMLQSFYQRYSSMEEIFRRSSRIREGIIALRKELFRASHHTHVEKHISNPLTGSSAKRINLFLRWMVRKDANNIDKGIWKEIPASRLIIPLDVHVQRTALKLGLIKQKYPSWKSAESLTQQLKLFCPVDPVKYDYALFGLSFYDNFSK